MRIEDIITGTLKQVFLFACIFALATTPFTLSACGNVNSAASSGGDSDSEDSDESDDDGDNDSGDGGGGGGSVTGITLGTISGNTTEAGGTATFTVVLKSAPTADVTVSVTSGDTGEVTVSPASLTFTASNSTVLQTVTVTGVDDAIADGNQTVTVTLTASTSDANYNGITDSISVINEDNPSP